MPCIHTRHRRFPAHRCIGAKYTLLTHLFAEVLFVELHDLVHLQHAHTCACALCPFKAPARGDGGL